MWKAHGLDKLNADESVAFCEKLFAEHLGGHTLMTNARHMRGSAWLNFQRVKCEQWSHFNGRAHVVLMGDAVHTAHFAIGSGTKLAIEDAIELARQFKELGATRPRPRRSARCCSATRHCAAWMCCGCRTPPGTRWSGSRRVGQRYADSLPPEQFMYSMLTRSQRISHENLRLRDKAWLEGYERWFARPGRPELADDATPPPPMFTPYRVRGVTLKNRVIVSPMAQYSAVDGTPGDYHLVHLGARAMGGAGLVFAEMTCVSAEGRITPGCPGLYAPEHLQAGSASSTGSTRTPTPRWRCRSATPAPKASTRVAWEGGDEPLPEGNWPIMAASRLQYLEGVSQIPKSMSRADMLEVTAQFVRSTQMAARGRLRLAGTALRARLPAVGLHLAADESPRRRLRWLASRTACAFRWKCLPRCAPPGRRSGRCRCASRRTTGSKAASRPTTRWRSRAPSRPPAPT